MRQDKQEGGEGEDEGMCGGGGTWRGGDGTSKYLSESHPRFGSAGHYWSYLCFTRSKTSAAAEGDVDVDAGECAAEAGYDSTLLVVISILVDIDGAGWIRVSGLWGPPHAPAHLAGDPTRNLISKPRARRSPRAYPLHSKPQSRTRTSLTPSRTKAQPRALIQANTGTRGSTHELVHACLVH